MTENQSIPTPVAGEKACNTTGTWPVTLTRSIESFGDGTHRDLDLTESPSGGEAYSQVLD